MIDQDAAVANAHCGSNLGTFDGKVNTRCRGPASPYTARAHEAYISGMRKRRKSLPLLLPAALACCTLLASCSLNRLAVRTVAGFLTASGESTVFSGDDDPQLVGDALPFILKTYESLVASDPA